MWPSPGTGSSPAPILDRFSSSVIGTCVPWATSASSRATLRAARISAAKGNSRSVLSSRVLSGMIANTHAPGLMRDSACSRIARSSPADRSDSGDPFPMKAGDGWLLMIVKASYCRFISNSDAQLVPDNTNDHRKVGRSVNPQRFRWLFKRFELAVEQRRIHVMPTALGQTFLYHPVIAFEINKFDPLIEQEKLAIAFP